jgi:hypothetical protein
MAATFHWCEDNGAQTGSPLHGTTRSGFPADTHYPTDVNWKNADDCTANGGTAYSAAPIGPPAANSYTKYQYGHFIGGSFNQISAGLFAHTVTAFGSNITLKGTATSTYATPTTATNAALTTDMTTAIAISSGLAVNFSTTGPEGAGPASTLSADGYTQYLATQLQIAAGVAPGDTAQVTLTLGYNEN